MDTIRKTAGVGSVKPLGPLRPVARRRQSHRESGDRREDAEKPQDPLPAETDDRQDDNAPDACREPATEEEADAAKPGRCIDVRV